MTDTNKHLQDLESVRTFLDDVEIPYEDYEDGQQAMAKVQDAIDHLRQLQVELDSTKHNLEVAQRELLQA